MKTKHKKGDVFGSWTLERFIKKGGNSLVWVVKNEQSQEGAIKISDYRLNNKKKYNRFRDEVNAFEKCQDIDGVLPLLDYHIPDHTDSGINSIPWLVTKLAIPLEEAIGNDYALETVIQACVAYSETLCTMHLRGYSHRDIKPANLFRLNNKWCVGDFGLAWFLGKYAKTGTKEHIGSRFYIAPEMLIDAAAADGSLADVYSLAKTLWKIATRQRYPLEGTIRADESSTRLSTYSNQPRSYLLDTFIEHATKNNPSERISMKNFSDELKSWIHTPAVKNKNEEMSLSHLSYRLESLQGRFKTEQKIFNNSNKKVEQRINTFLGRFSSGLDFMNSELKKMEIEVQRANGQGNYHAWFLQMGNEGTSDTYFWQNYLTANIRRMPGTHQVGFFVGICVRINVEKNVHGIKYIENGPVSAVAAIGINADNNKSWVNLKKHVGEIREFILSGPQEDVVYQEFNDLLKDNFASGFESALGMLESNNQSTMSHL